ncbi:MAG: hypothetical protein AB8G22_09840 [Saprospiraceae bacterium]
MEFIGLLFELLLLGAGFYLYRLSMGRVKTDDEALKERADGFLESNRTIIRIGALALMAIMTVNIILHLLQWGG